MNLRKKTIEDISSEKEKEFMKILEAIFFVSGRFLSISELITLSGIGAIEIEEILEKLKRKYEKETFSLEIIQKGNLWKMDVKPNYSYLINKLATGSSEFSGAEKETLAIIAYKNPIKQSVIIKIRGNKAYDHIKKFYDLNLIKKKKIGHTYELILSEEFYDYFNLSTESKNPLKIKLENI